MITLETIKEENSYTVSSFSNDMIYGLRYLFGLLMLIIIFVSSKMINKPIIQQSATWLVVSYCIYPIGLWSIEDADWHHQNCAMISCL